MKLLKSLPGIFLIFLLSCPNAYAASNTKTLNENTSITPPGAIARTRAEIPVFKKGSVVTLNDFGEVIEGILAENLSLPYESGDWQNSARAAYFTPAPPPPVIIPRPTPPVFVPYSTDTVKTPLIRKLSFKAGTKVVFNDRGEVIRGTITTDETIYLNPANKILVSSGAEISFHKNGMVANCTLAKNSYLRPVGWLEILTDNFSERIECSGFVEFKADKPIKLNDKGEVIKGTLNNDTKLTSTFLGGREKKLYKAETTVQFDNQGIVIKAEEPDA